MSSNNFVKQPNSIDDSLGEADALMMDLSFSPKKDKHALPGCSRDLPSSTTELLADLSLGEKEKPFSEKYLAERESLMTTFSGWPEGDQVDFVKQLLQVMCHYQHGQINTFLKPMLQRDFISLLPARGLSHLGESVLSYLDAKSLCSCELVCRKWRSVIAEGMLWKKLIERKVRTDSLWKGLSEKRGWQQYLFKSKDRLSGPILATFGCTRETLSVAPATANAKTVEFMHRFYRKLYPDIERDIETIESNWKCGRNVLQRINCHSENSKGVYCLQYDDDKIISGLRDNTIKVWDRQTLACVRTLTGHTGSVLCLQYDDQVIISGSSDSTVRVWDVNTGVQLNILIHHGEAVLHLRFQNGMMVTCSKDRSIAVWDMVIPQEINLRRVLVGHRAAVNVVDFDQTYIVSASGDRTIKVWSTDSSEFVRTLSGHKRGIACLQYRDRLVVSGSSDNTIRLWDIECGACLRVLEGHEELVRCIRFDAKRIVSGAYDGKIKVWDLQAALDPRSVPNTLCINTLNEHTGRVFRLQFDEFQIVSSSHDDTILIWDFLNYTGAPTAVGGSRAITNGDQAVGGENAVLPGQVGNGQADAGAGHDDGNAEMGDEDHQSEDDDDDDGVVGAPPVPAVANDGANGMVGGHDESESATED